MPTYSVWSPQQMSSDEHISPHKAVDLGIPSVLDDATKAFVNDQIDISVSSIAFIPPSPSMTSLNSLNISNLNITAPPINTPVLNLEADDEEIEIAQHNPWETPFGRSAPAAPMPTPSPNPVSAPAERTAKAPGFNPLAILLPTLPTSPAPSSRTLPLPEPPTPSFSAPASGSGRSLRPDFADLTQSWNNRTAAQGTTAVERLSKADLEDVPVEELGAGFGLVIDDEEDKHVQRRTLAETMSTKNVRDMPVLTGMFENPWN
ncbi:hypothetical protein BC936DRAFT_144638 [Jimgerdemannia flammicorona]|uniref:Uncharacterized protein n=1 Tax=Jimgerdemannia flammicorona TaxID=994334 RepID=A0A433DC35_9FUNG|nr:hypothetical protein BC936DRAFT_144638 [Jimgerdemannia flammicorona]